MIKTNYHTHTKLCGHAEDMPIDYAKKAVEIGLIELGISDHGPLLPEWTFRMNLDSFNNVYLPSINEAKKTYKGKLKIYAGLELEYIDEYYTNGHYQKLLSKLDYLILGQHIVCENNHLVDPFKYMNDNMVNNYCEQVIKGMNTGLFKILAHPDLFMYKYLKWNDLTENISRRIIECAIKNNVYLELNANGVRRGEILNENNEKTWLYPRLEFWRIVKEYKNVKIIISDDAHHIRHLHDEATFTLEKFAKELGLNIIEKVF